MKEIDRIIGEIRSNENTLRKRYHIKSISVFGSFARGEENKDSDIDLLVEFDEPVGFTFFQAARYLEQITGRRVDLVTKDAIKPAIADSVMKELLHV
jgi:uncharacterized protein